MHIIDMTWDSVVSRVDTVLIRKTLFRVNRGKFQYFHPFEPVVNRKVLHTAASTHEGRIVE